MQQWIDRRRGKYHTVWLPWGYFVGAFSIFICLYAILMTGLSLWKLYSCAKVASSVGTTNQQHSAIVWNHTRARLVYAETWWYQFAGNPNMGNSGRQDVWFHSSLACTFACCNQRRYSYARARSGRRFQRNRIYSHSKEGTPSELWCFGVYQLWWDQEGAKKWKTQMWFNLIYEFLARSLLQGNQSGVRGSTYMDEIEQ